MGYLISDKILEAASNISAATMHEAAGKIGYLPSEIKPIADGMKICGRAFPVQGPSGCNLWLHRASAKATPGDVLVVNVGSDPDYGYWGDIMGTGAISRGINGLVINGCVRDKVELIEMGFPVFSMGLSIRGTSKNFEGSGSLAEPILMGGVDINHGDLIIGDNDGLVAIPADQAESSIEKSIERENKEEATKEKLRNGETTMEIYGWPEK